MARELVHAAAEAGADAVKFQTFDADKLVLPNAATADYQRQNMRGADNQRKMLQALELSREAHFALRDPCRTAGIEFMSSGFDPASIAFLADDVGVTRLKIPSGEIINGPLLLRAARSGLPLIVSTVLEKHFSLSRRLPGPDHVASLEPDELAAMVREVRDVERALGSGEKAPLDAELRNRVPAWGSLVAVRAIRAGERFSPVNVTIKRPGDGVSPLLYWDVVAGLRAERDYDVDEQIDPVALDGRD